MVRNLGVRPTDAMIASISAGPNSCPRCSGTSFALERVVYIFETFFHVETLKPLIDEILKLRHLPSLINPRGEVKNEFSLHTAPSPCAAPAARVMLSFISVPPRSLQPAERR